MKVMGWESQLIALLSASLVRPFILVAAAGLVLRIFRVRHPASKHAVWSVVLAALVLLPLVSVATPHWNLPLLPRHDESPASVLKAPVAAAPEPVEAVEPTEAAPVVGEAISLRTGFRMPSLSTLVVWCYLAGLLAMLLYRAAGWTMLRWVIARSTPLRGKALRESRDVVAPVAVGVLRPAVILPIDWRAWNPDTRRAVLAHELAHIRRRDTLISALGRAVKSVLWFHPLAWWVSRRVSELAELSCDAVALESIRDPGGYSRILLEFASGVNRAGHRVALPGLAMAAGSSGIGNRIDQVFELSSGSARKLTRPGTLLVLIGLPVVGLAATVGFGESNERPLPLQTFTAPKAPPAPDLIAQAQAPAQARPPVPAPRAAAPVAPKAAAQDDLVFEVASVRALDPVAKNTNGGSRVIGGPGTDDPERLRYTEVAMMQILSRAFLMQADQFVGPDWVKEPYGAERFEIIAKVPPGTTIEQANIMMLNLLKERFHLAYHREKRDLDVYELTLAKNGSKVGSKLKDAEIPAELPAKPSGPSQTYVGDDGFPNLPPGWPTGVGVGENGMSMFQTMSAYGGFRLWNPGGGPPRGVLSFAFRMITMTQFTAWLQDIDGIAHLVDRTGLTGKYDIKLRFSNSGGTQNAPGEASDPAPDLPSALEKQLGLKLQKIKAPVDVIVIDHIDQTPVEN